MEVDKFESYLKDRYNDQIKWYSDKSSRNKSLYMVFQWGVIIFSTSLPVLVASIPKEYQWITIGISIILAIGTGSLKTFKFQENWVNYRTISESLKKEKHFYDAELSDYSNSDDKEALFVERVETLISRENSLWISTHTQKEEKEKKG